MTIEKDFFRNWAPFYPLEGQVEKVWTQTVKLRRFSFFPIVIWIQARRS